MLAAPVTRSVQPRGDFMGDSAAMLAGPVTRSVSRPPKLQPDPYGPTNVATPVVAAAERCGGDRNDTWGGTSLRFQQQYRPLR